MRAQLLGRQQKNTATAPLKLQPDKREITECSPHSRFRVAHFDDEQPAGPQIPAGFAQNHPHGIETGIPRSERN
jgi:hypothetical protein